MRSRAPLALLLAACTGAPDAPAPDAPDLPSPYTYVPADVGDGVDPAIMQAELQAVFDRLRELHAGPPLDAYAQVRLLGDRMCPPETVTDSVDNGRAVYFDGQCIARGHYWFKGPMTTYSFVDNPLELFQVAEMDVHDEHRGYAWTGRAIRGQTDIYDDRSDLDFNCSCTAFSATSATGGVDRWLSFVDGPSHWVSDDAPPSWIDEGLQVRLYLVLGRAPDAGGSAWTARIAGALTGAAEVYGTIDVDLSLSGTRAADGALVCDEGGGTVVMRETTTGVRTSLAFAVDASCLACATVEDTPVCLDVSSLQDWEAAPW